MTVLSVQRSCEISWREETLLSHLTTPCEQVVSMTCWERSRFLLYKLI